MKVSVRSTIVAAMAGLLAVTVAVIFTTSLISTRKVLDAELSRVVTSDAEQAAISIDTFLLPAEQAARVGAGTVRSNLDEGLDATTSLEAQFLSILESVEQLDGIFVGEADGSFFFVNRDDSRSTNGTRTKSIQIGPDGRTTTLTWRDSEGQITTSEVDPEDTYDPRTRPWYSGLTTETESLWTDPYIFFTSGQPGVTTSSPIVHNGEVAAVVGVDVQLDGITTFLESLRTSPNSRSALMHGSQVIAIPNEEAVTSGGTDSARYRTRDDLAGTILGSALLQTPRLVNDQITTTSHVAFEFDKEASHAGFAPLPESDLSWYVVVAAPESDFLSELRASQRTILTIVALVGIIGIALAAGFATTITKPLTQLRESARQLREGHLGVPVQSRFVEIDETADALYTAHSELEQRVARRTQALEIEVAERREAELRAVAANKTKSEFLANVSHELRTPLTAVIGYANVLSSMSNDLTPKDVSENAEIIEQAGAHLLELINDLLDLAKIEAGEMELDESLIDMRELLTEVDRLMRPRAEARDLALTIHADPEPLLLADRRRIKQILLNLASNGIKFTPEGGRVDIAVSEDDGCIRIVVADTGVGMDEAEIERAFEMFGQVASDQGKHDGTGIGLPLTQHLVNDHDGTLHVESEKGQGTSITITFPAHRTVVPSTT